MVGDPLADYTPTLIRFIGVAISLVVLIFVVYFVFRHVFGWRIEAAAGLALIMCLTVIVSRFGCFAPASRISPRRTFGTGTARRRMRKRCSSPSTAARSSGARK